jgi:apolipoprotein N-acyltransferase
MSDGTVVERAEGGPAVQLRWRCLFPLRLVVAEASAWRQMLLAFVLGLAATGALPPLHIWPLLIPAFSGLLWLTEDAKRPRQAFAVGWWFGFGYFVAGLYWIANAFLVEPEQFGWLAPIAVLGLSGYLAMFTAAAAFFTRLTGFRGISAVLVLAASWTAFEWARGWVLTGFPWNMIGTAWAFSDSMIQITSLVGTLGLTLITVIAAAMPATLADPGRKGRLGIVGIAAASLAMVLVYAGGSIRLSEAGVAQMVPGVQLRLVQPNIPQWAKLQRALLDVHLADHLHLALEAADPPPTHIIWGETAAAFFLADDAGRRERVAEATPPEGLTIVGTLRQPPEGQEFQVWNSLIVVNSGGSVVDYYDKAYLVPLGEYVPLRNVLGILGIGKLTAGTIDFSRGPGRRTLNLPGLPPVSPLICYEVIFPGNVTERSDRPQWLLNLTNDAWYGLSSGPYQHFAAARLRAVEEGLPLVRVANTGISGIVDPYGRIIGQLGLSERGVVDGPLPMALASETFYARLGNAGGLLLAAVAALAGWILRRGS